MNVGQLRAVLQELHEILVAANAKPQSKNVETFLGLFQGADDIPVEQFLRSLESRLAGQESPTSAPSRLPSRDVVDRHLSILKSAGTDKRAFEDALDNLRCDRQVDKPEVEVIAYEYINYAEGRRSWPSRKAAIQSIEDWFERLAYDAVRSTQLDKARYAR